jgi:hypothetical protein
MGQMKQQEMQVEMNFCVCLGHLATPQIKKIIPLYTE